MAFRYETVVPWGRSFDEYRRMFALTDRDLEGSILGCADGPAGFNARMSKRGGRVVSCDPLYQLAAPQIRDRIDATYRDVIEQTRQNRDRFVWESVRSPDELGKIRMEAMTEFLADYEGAARGGRYVAAELPHLPFAPGAFDLALCSHFLFLYSDNLSYAFHRQAVWAMCRAARESRIFPLLDYNAQPSPHLDALVEDLRQAGFGVSLETVPYEFQRGGNQMLRVTAVQS